MLVLLAHPDDELFVAGLVWRYRQSGVPVSLCYATRGENGRTRDSQPGHQTAEQLAELRQRELASAARSSYGASREHASAAAAIDRWLAELTPPEPTAPAGRQPRKEEDRP